ncbi:arginase family protein [Amycolatopsis regifaucium]|uniref:arginase family protein n=1 Tax=Amycolatopsis regifaucium TaxID=546365 RepID=UPI001ABF8BE2|nr:arginase family protein [Amycolatopsis regifaucium]
MALAMLTGRTPDLFDDTLDFSPIPDTSVVLADARDLDPAERDALTASGVRRIPADPGAITSALDRLGDVPVYLHLDIDVIDGAQLPGARFPSGPGPSLAQIEECLAAARATADIPAAYIACVWLPEHARRADQPPDDDTPHHSTRRQPRMARTHRQLTRHGRAAFAGSAPESALRTRACQRPPRSRGRANVLRHSAHGWARLFERGEVFRRAHRLHATGTASCPGDQVSLAHPGERWCIRQLSQVSAPLSS